MKPQELIGKEIAEIRCEISRFDYEGSIPLEEIDVEMKLSTGEIISFPHHPEAHKIECGKFNPKLKKIFPQNGISKFLNKPNGFEKLINQKIIGIWIADDDFGEEICLLEFQNGCFLTKGPMSPIGTGNADLFLFESKNKVKDRYEEDIKKVI